MSLGMWKAAMLMAIWLWCPASSTASISTEEPWARLFRTSCCLWPASISCSSDHRQVMCCSSFSSISFQSVSKGTCVGNIVSCTTPPQQQLLLLQQSLPAQCLFVYSDLLCGCFFLLCSARGIVLSPHSEHCRQQSRRSRFLRCGPSWCCIHIAFCSSCCTS